MHKLRGVARRRTVNLAAGVVLTGGVIGGVLLTSGAAYAGTASITITSATPSHGFGGGTSLDVQVSTSGGSGGSFSVSGAGNGCSGVVDPISGSGGCDIGGVAPGNYSLVANYEGASSAAFPVTVAGNPNPAPTNPGPTNPGPTNPGPTNPGPTSPPTNPPSNPAPAGNAPAFSTDTPPTSVNGQSYSYQFQASNSPSFELVGAPSWLSINNNGLVSGNIPAGITSFSYSVKSWNNFGWTVAGPFNVFFRNNFFRHEHVNLSTTLSCTSPVFTGRHGTCTLTVFNYGGGFAPDVTAQIALPWQLRADFCGNFQFWNWSSNQYWNNYWNNNCSISGNTAYESLGSLFPWQSKELTVTFTALSGRNIWGRHPGWNDTVQVVGSASSGFNNFFGSYNWDYQFWGQRQNYSVAWVTIIPRGRWW